MDDSNQSAVEKTVREFIGKNPAVKSNHVEMDMSLKDLNIDSLEKLSIGMDLEDEYSIEFTDEEIEEFATVSDVVTAVETALTAKTEAQVASTPPQQSQHKTSGTNHSI
ncbi:acyl carrier protein [SAR92 clade bacterium H231]|jgi:acyl carrier protein|nr:acyl carrier protein [Porticoccaceae bacterium]MCT2531789.1 acyl carrier protein [SAR92 clade bacterium H231]MBT6105290.1 acyl carrier protein [Porticoccaceae bacterium]MBT7904817.1 acyl carrier protein [Porticoccaceae bacterium]MDB2480612.1 acyl carrier protein [Porticoccaceae bacterium]